MTPKLVCVSPGVWFLAHEVVSVQAVGAVVETLTSRGELARRSYDDAESAKVAAEVVANAVNLAMSK